MFKDELITLNINEPKITVSKEFYKDYDIEEICKYHNINYKIEKENNSLYIIFNLNSFKNINITFETIQILRDELYQRIYLYDDKKYLLLNRLDDSLDLYDVFSIKVENKEIFDLLKLFTANYLIKNYFQFDINLLSTLFKILNKNILRSKK